MGKGKEKILVKSKRQAHPIFKGKQQVPPKLQYLTRALSMFFSDVSDHEFIADEGKCCVCDKLEPEQLKFNSYVEFVRLGQCQWEHCVHTPPYQGKVFRRDTQITCPNCV